MKKYIALSDPMIYINSFYLSPDKSLLAVKACSDKSDFLFVISPLNGKIGFENGYSTDLSIDGENYCLADEIKWVENNVLRFCGNFIYNDVGKMVDYEVEYDFSNGNISVTKV